MPHVTLMMECVIVCVFLGLSVISFLNFLLGEESLEVSFCGSELMYSDSDWSTHWGRVTHICISKLTIIGSDMGLLPGQWHQAIIWTNAGILLNGTLGTNCSEILSKIRIFLFKKMHLKVSVKWRQFCLCLNVLKLELVSLLVWSQAIPFSLRLILEQISCCGILVLSLCVLESVCTHLWGRFSRSKMGNQETQ